MKVKLISLKDDHTKNTILDSPNVLYYDRIIILHSTHKEKPKLMMSFFGRHKILVSVVLLALVVVVGSGCSDSGAGQTEPVAARTTMIMDTVSGKRGLSYRIVSAERSDRFGQDIFADGGEFVSIHVTVENTGRVPMTVDSTDFSLVDPMGRRYSRSSEAMTAMMMRNIDCFFIETVQPGMSLSGFVSFKVPMGLDQLTVVIDDGLMNDDLSIQLSD